MGDPFVYKAVRAVGIVKATFAPQDQRIFAEKLEVIGTAFWLKEFHVLVTCAHVVKNLACGPVEFTGLLVVGGNRRSYRRARIGIIDFERDLAILRPEGMPEEIRKEAEEEGLTIGGNYPDVGTKMIYAGFPLGTQLLGTAHTPTYAEGVINSHPRQQGYRKLLQITGTVAGGFSGAPIVTESEPSKVVGVLSSSPSKEAAEAGIFEAISWEHLQRIASLSHS